MASVRRGQGTMNIDLQQNDLPPVSALFLIYFDIKAGYTIGWKRSLPGIELGGVVEYKSLPSGLHTVKEDLIYFVHGEHAGLSAFVNAPAAEEARNARMIAVGVLVPLSYGRLGRSWKHAEKLKDMADELIVDSSNTKVLEDFWTQHRGYETSPQKEEAESSLDSPATGVRFNATQNISQKDKHRRNRSASDGAALLPPGNTLSAYHPAWSLLNLLEAFGPLIFPIHRAALLRKRILITTHAPVEQTCNFVYDLSVLSNIPLAVSDLLTSNAPPQRLRPLFSIGVHDIPLLEQDLRASKSISSLVEEEDVETRDEVGRGWIACTTDSIFATKNNLYDVLVTLPPAHSANSSSKVWPKVQSSSGLDVKATQRDLRRYKALRWGLANHVSPPTSPSPNPILEPTTPQTISSLSPQRDGPMLDLPDTDDIVEPASWSALAYSGFIWWASAGEQRLHSEEEFEADDLLLSGLSLMPSTPNTPFAPRTPSQSMFSLRSDGQARQEMGIIAYFHRLTTQILTTLSDIVDVTDSDDEREDNDLLSEDDGPSVYASSADMERMGLDVWSAADHQFIEEVTREYFGRRATVEGRTVNICGVRIC